MRTAAARQATGGSRADAKTGELLSFIRLRPIANEEEANELYGTPWPEPIDTTRGRLAGRGTSKAEIEYRFVTKWSEPAALFKFVSKQFPALDFLLGAVAPAVGEANCWYFRAGRGRNW
jgi:hypothetical protein